MSINKAIQFFQEATTNKKTVDRLYELIREELSELIRNENRDFVFCVHSKKGQVLNVSSWLYEDIGKAEKQTAAFEIDFINLSVECVNGGIYANSIEIIEAMKKHISKSVFGEGFING